MMSLFHLLLAVASLAISVSSFQSSGLPTTSSLVNTLHTHNNKNNNNKLSSVTFLNNPQPIIAAGMQQQFSTSNLFSTTTTDDDAASSSSANNDNEETSKLDVDAIVKYTGALATQMVLFTGLFVGLDKLVTTTGIQVPFALNFIFFYFCALKSRILNPLQNSRPQVSNKEIEIAPERKMPQWTPPGFIFPVVWLLLIGPLRAATTSMVYSAAGSYCNKAILSLMLHLSIGDIWNTINNVERRYGTSVLGIVCVYTSAAFAAFQYSKVLPVAGKLLSLKMIWLTIASSLIIQTWRLNKNPKTGKNYSLLPKTGEGSRTEVAWFNFHEKQM